jgi:hypothetical protein
MQGIKTEKKNNDEISRHTHTVTKKTKTHKRKRRKHYKYEGGKNM